MSKKKSNNRDLEELLKVINTADFKAYRLSHTRNDTEEKFNVTALEYCNLAKHLNLFNYNKQKYEKLNNISRDDLRLLLLKYSTSQIADMYNVGSSYILRLKHKYDLVNKSYVDLWLEIYKKDELEEYYKTHTQRETQKKFNLNQKQFLEVLAHLNLNQRSKEADYKRRKETFLSHYGKLENPEGYDAKRDRYKKTMINKYGADNPSRVPELKNQAIQTLQKFKDDNKMHQSSKLEKRLLIVLAPIFGEDLKYQHFDKEIYPFNCDFYIESVNVWIELNGWWHHGQKPYDGSKEDLQILEEAKIKYPKQYYSFEKVWTRSDPEKYEYAKKNNLNYFCIYDNGSIYNNEKKLIFKLSSLYNIKEVVKYIQKITKEI